MSLWKELDEIKSDEIRIYAGGGPGTLEEYVDFSEMEVEAREAIGTYTGTALNHVTKELELRVCDAILKYLMISFGDLERCTENVISSRLGIPRSRLRRLLAFMEWNEIIQSVPIGKASPYILHNISKALSEGYLRLSPSEGEKLTKIYEHMGHAIHYPDPKAVIFSAMQGTIPEPLILKESRDWAMRNLRPEKTEQIKCPFFPGAVTSFRTVPNDYHTLRKFLNGPGNAGILTDILLELNVPEQVTEEDLMEASKKVIEKYLRLVTATMKPLYDMVKTGRPYRTQKASMKQQLLSGDKVATYFYGDVLLDKRVFDPEHGLINLQTEHPNESHIILVSNILRAALRLSKHVNVDERYIKEAEEMLKVLESASQEEMDTK